MKLAKLNERRHAEFFDVIRSSLKVNTTDTFRDWVQHSLKYIFPHEALICGIGKIENQSADIHQVITCNLPGEYMKSLQLIGGIKTSPVFSQWIKTKRPVLFESTTQHGQSDWYKNFNHFGLNNMAAHGLCDISSHTTSYFSFSKIPGNLTSQHAEMLEMLVPYLHVTLLRTLNSMKGNEVLSLLPLKKQLLTDRQKEILTLFSQGYSYKEIAEKVQVRSHKTIEQHLDSVRIKFSVKTRRECIQKAISMGLL